MAEQRLLVVAEYLEKTQTLLIAADEEDEGFGNVPTDVRKLAELLGFCRNWLDGIIDGIT